MIKCKQKNILTCIKMPAAHGWEFREKIIAIATYSLIRVYKDKVVMFREKILKIQKKKKEKNPQNQTSHALCIGHIRNNMIYKLVWSLESEIVVHTPAASAPPGSFQSSNSEAYPRLSESESSLYQDPWVTFM